MPKNITTIDVIVNMAIVCICYLAMGPHLLICLIFMYALAVFTALFVGILEFSTTIRGLLVAQLHYDNAKPRIFSMMVSIVLMVLSIWYSYFLLAAVWAADLLVSTHLRLTFISKGKHG